MNAQARGIYQRAFRAPVRQHVGDLEFDAPSSERIDEASVPAEEALAEERRRRVRASLLRGRA